MKPRSKMMGMIEQVLDEIQAMQGSDTEVTVALVRATWDEVHPTAPVPSPATVRNNLDQMTEMGKLAPMPGGKSWMFAEMPVKDEPLPTAPAPEPEKKAAPASFDWVEVKPAHFGAKAEYAVSVYFAPGNKVPSIMVRVRKDLEQLLGKRVRIFFDRKGNAIALHKGGTQGFKLTEDKRTSKNHYSVRIAGATAIEIMEILHITGNKGVQFCSFTRHEDAIVCVGDDICRED